MLRKGHIITCLLFVGIVIFIFFLNYGYTINYIDSESMEPTIMKKSLVICKRLKESAEIKRGDIITFRHPLNKNEVYIKRVVGLPGESVEISDGTIMIDNQLLEEDYNVYKWTKQIGDYTFYIPEDSYVVLGDNRNVSEDSRIWSELYSQNEGNHFEDKGLAYIKRDSIISRWEE